MANFDGVGGESLRIVKQIKPKGIGKSAGDQWSVSSGQKLVPLRFYSPKECFFIILKEQNLSYDTTTFFADEKLKIDTCYQGTVYQGYECYAIIKILNLCIITVKSLMRENIDFYSARAHGLINVLISIMIISSSLYCFFLITCPLCTFFFSIEPTWFMNKARPSRNGVQHPRCIKLDFFSTLQIKSSRPILQNLIS